jgi:hypothetical protein
MTRYVTMAKKQITFYVFKSIVLEQSYAVFYGEGIIYNNKKFVTNTAFRSVYAGHNYAIITTYLITIMSLSGPIFSLV